MITTKGKTVQEVLDEIAQALIKQGKQCIDDKDCIYGDSEGNHCAVGWLLPENDDYLMSFRGTINTMIRTKHSLGENQDFLFENNNLLYEIQQLHDSESKLLRNYSLNEIKKKFNFNMDAWIPWVELGV